MEKKSKIIIGVLVGIIVILLIIIACLVKGKEKVSNEESQEEVSEYVGAYDNSNWNGKEAVLILNADMTCKYPNSNENCVWSISNNEITMTLSNYGITYDNEDEVQLTSYSQHIEKEECEEEIANLKKIFDLENPRCEIRSTEHTGTYINSSVILYDHAFMKIG